MTIPAEVGVNETTAFMFALNGGASIGLNQNFPSGPSTRISGVSTLDDFWREYFRYFLYYQTKTPSLKSIRVAVGYDFGGEDTYNLWKLNPAAYYAVFDPMVKWAEAASVDLIPVVMHCSQNDAATAPANRYKTEPTRTSHLVEFSRALMAKYEASPSIVLWDLLNEPRPQPNDGMGAWVTSLVSQIRSATTKPITMGFDAEFVRDPARLSTLMSGLDVWEDHFYTDNAFLSSIGIIAGWAAPKQFLAGEIGTNITGGWFPAATLAWIATGNPACAMALWGGGIGGAYPGYPYTGPLPDYPAGPPPPANIGPIAAFLVSPSPQTAKAITFDASASKDPDGTIARYEWYFDDWEPIRVVTSPIVSKTYAAAGIYTVWLTVVDDKGAANSINIPVTVTDLPPPPPTPDPDLTQILADITAMKIRLDADDILLATVATKADTVQMQAALAAHAGVKASSTIHRHKHAPSTALSGDPV